MSDDVTADILEEDQSNPPNQYNNTAAIATELTDNNNNNTNTTNHHDDDNTESSHRQSSTTASDHLRSLSPAPDTDGRPLYSIQIKPLPASVTVETIAKEFSAYSNDIFNIQYLSADIAFNTAACSIKAAVIYIHFLTESVMDTVLQYYNNNPIQLPNIDNNNNNNNITVTAATIENRLFIGNISRFSDDNSVRNAVESIGIPIQQFTRRAHYAFVSYSNVYRAVRARRLLSQIVLSHSHWKIETAKPSADAHRLLPPELANKTINQSTASSSSATATASAANVRPVRGVYIDKLTMNTTVDMVRDHFSSIQPIIDIRLPNLDSVKIRHKRVGFIEFNSFETAQRCVREMNGSTLDGAVITVELQKPHKPSTDRDRDRDRGRDRDRDRDSRDRYSTNNRSSQRSRSPYSYNRNQSHSARRSSRSRSRSRSRSPDRHRHPPPQPHPQRSFRGDYPPPPIAAPGPYPHYPMPPPHLHYPGLPYPPPPHPHHSHYPPIPPSAYHSPYPYPPPQSAAAPTAGSAYSPIASYNPPIPAALDPRSPGRIRALSPR